MRLLIMDCNTGCFSDGVLGEIYTENTALGIVLKYAVVHRVEKEQKVMAKMGEERVKSREAKQAKKAEDGVKTVQVLAEKVNQAEVQAQKKCRNRGHGSGICKNGNEPWPEQAELDGFVHILWDKEVYGCLGV